MNNSRRAGSHKSWSLLLKHNLNAGGSFPAKIKRPHRFSVAGPGTSRIVTNANYRDPYTSEPEGDLLREKALKARSLDL
jgi:hypothetical protein